MAFIDQNKRSHPIAMTATIVLQGVAIYALIQGLAVSFIPEVTTVLRADNVPADIPPPPPKPQPSASPTIDIPTPQPALERKIELPSVRDPVSTDFRQIPSGEVITPLPQITPPPIPDPTPTFVPRMASPRGNLAGWATPADYPARDLREGNQGVARFQLTIGMDGRVQACRITQSTGFAGLDQATCSNVSRRARFEAATDGSGARAAGSYSGSVRWVIPRD